MPPPRAKEFAWFEGLALCLAAVATQLSSEVMNQWGLYFYSPSEGVGRTLYVAIKFVWIIFFVATLWDAVTDPLIGSWSDRTRTRPRFWRWLRPSGRRRPYIFWGSILMTFTAVAFWYPPVEGTAAANLAYGTVLLCLHWTMFTVTVVPLLALAPEIARSERERIRLGTWVAVGMILGLAMAAVAPGALIVQLDPARTEDRLTLTFPADRADSVPAALTALVPAGLEAEVRFVASADGLAPVLSEEYAGLADCVQDQDGWSVSFTGQLISELDFAHAHQAVAAVLPEAMRGPITLVPDEKGRVALRLTGPLHGPIGFRRTKGDVTVSLSGDLVSGHVAGRIETALARLVPEQWRNDVAQQSQGLDHVLVVSGELAKQLAFVPDETGLSVFLSDELLGDLASGHVQQTLEEHYPGAVEITRVLGTFSAAGYRRLALVLALLSTVLFQFPVWLVRERYDSDAVTEEHTPLLEGLRDAVHNRPFMIYAAAFFLFTVGFLGFQRALPYWAELGIGGDESTVTLLMIPFLITAMVSYAVIPALARRLHVKWMMFIAFATATTGLPWMYVIGVAPLAAGTKMVLGGILFGYCGFGQGIMYVMMPPMVGECIDYDEIRSGRRREALYNGLNGFVLKASVGGGIFFATQSMSFWGNSLENATGVLLVGPIAGLFTLAGLVVMAFYPVLHVTREHEDVVPAPQDPTQ